MKLSELHINKKNPRLIGNEKFRKLCESIRTFPAMMELRPIVVNKEKMILGGNMRFKACQKLGYKEIPDNWVRIADKLTEEEQKRFTIEDNVTHGEWDMDLIKEWDEKELQEWGFDIKIKSDFEKEFELYDDLTCQYPIVKKYSEKYGAVIIIYDNEIDETYLITKLNLEIEKSYKSNNLGRSFVIDVKKFKENAG